jgi:hypothetical protein
VNPTRCIPSAPLNRLATIAAMLFLLASVQCMASNSKKSESKNSVPKKSICLSTTVGFGQKTSSLWCRVDSCFLMQFARSNPAPLRNGLFGIALDSLSRAEGDTLATVMLRRKDWVFKQASSVTTLHYGDSSTLSIPRHPFNSRNLDGIETWGSKLDSLMTSQPGHPLWSDSLIVYRTGPTVDEVAIRLASKSNLVTRMVPSGVSRILISSGPPSQTGPMGMSWDSQDSLPQACLMQVLSGQTCLQKVPRSTRILQVVLKAGTPPPSSQVHNTCLEGQFELVSEILDWTGKIPATSPN